MSALSPSAPAAPRIRRLLPAVVMAAATALALTGCEPGVFAPSETPGASATATESAEPTPTPTASEVVPTPTPTPAPTGSDLPTTPPIAGDLPCTDVLSAEQLYEFNPNFAATAEEGTLPGAIGDIADAGGTVCAYQHVTGPDRLVIGVLQQADGFTAVEFQSVGDLGVATSIEGDLAIAAASQYFGAAQDAQPLIDDVAGNLQ